MVPFSGMITHEGTITFTHTNGRSYNVLPSFPLYDQVKDKLREIAAMGNGDTEALRLELFELSQPKTMVTKSSGGRCTVEGTTVLYDGVPVKNFLAERIVWMVQNGFDAKPMMSFFENVKLNPSFRAVEELYRFMEANKMGITSDGMILAYKRVKDDYRDIYSGTFDNSVGARPEMPRNEVNDNPNQTCSDGLHVCSMAYLPHYGTSRANRVVICSIHPKDVVSVPVDYNNAKMRVCTYHVVGEIEDSLDDILGRTPVWNPPVHDVSDDDTDDLMQDLWDHDETDEEEDMHEPTTPVQPTKAVATTATFDFTAMVSDVTKRVTFIIINRIGVEFDDSDMNKTLARIGADDLDVVEIMFDMESEFKIKINDDEFDSRNTPNDIVGVVLTKLN